MGFRLTELNLNDLKAVPVPVPSPQDQRRIVAELTKFKDMTQTMFHLQQDTERELDAMLPAILNRAFRGEL